MQGNKSAYDNSHLSRFTGRVGLRGREEHIPLELLGLGLRTTERERERAIHLIKNERDNKRGDLYGFGD